MYIYVVYLNNQCRDKPKTPSFIHEFQLVATPKDNRMLDVRLEAGRYLYNACLGEAMKRLAAMRRSKKWPLRSRRKRASYALIWLTVVKRENSLLPLF